MSLSDQVHRRSPLAVTKCNDGILISEDGESVFIPNIQISAFIQSIKDVSGLYKDNRGCCGFKLGVGK